MSATPLGPSVAGSTGTPAAAAASCRAFIGTVPAWPATPVIVAGSTGSIPATARLMQVIAHLPAGAVVLPGLDLGLDDAGWHAVGGREA